MKIAIIGAGFAGLASAVFAREFLNPKQIVLFDKKGIGSGASGIAAGLLHPFSGLHSKKNPLGDLGMEETLSLLKKANALNLEPFYKKTAMIRPALNEKQFNSFKKSAEIYPELLWKEDVFNGFPGLFLEEVYVIHPIPYLKALFLLSQADLEVQMIDSLENLKEFDLTIITTGPFSFKETAHLKVTPLRGQILDVEYEGEIPINSQAYLLKNILGATFEHDNVTDIPCIETAKELLLPKITPFVPNLKVKGCKAAVRASTPTHMPLIHAVNEKTFLFTGLGSKGLLYHALFAKKLIKEILCRDISGEQ
jgi:glycine/D-amino acid oxidase-like deaminating enzyme